MNKKLALGMNPSTAAHRLRMDLLFTFVLAAGHRCYRCGKSLTRETFSIDHIEPWRKASDPVRVFFDPANIAYSHVACNSAQATPHNTGHTKYPQFVGVGRRPAATAADRRRVYNPKKRHEQYVRTGH